MGLLAMLIVGLIAGLIARAILPGNSMGMLGTIALGVVGSFVGGFLGSLVQSNGSFMDFHPTGLLGSIVGAVVVLALFHFAGSRRGLRA